MAVLLSCPNGIAWDAGGPTGSGMSCFGTTHWASTLLPGPLYVAAGSSGSIVVSSDAAGWAALPSGIDKQLNSDTWLDDQNCTHFIIVGNEGTVLSNMR